MIGDAVSFVDPARPEQGLLFDGRVAEDFKLLSGTWVHVGSIRVAGISALSPVAQDIVVTGHDRDDIGFLVFPNIAECRRLTGLGDDVPAGTVVGHPAIKERVREGLVRMKRDGGGSSTYPARVLLMAEPPSSEARRNDRQGLHQPARGADAPRRPRARTAFRRTRFQRNFHLTLLYAEHQPKDETRAITSVHPPPFPPRTGG
jgi:hypothetical protein